MNFLGKIFNKLLGCNVQHKEEQVFSGEKLAELIKDPSQVSSKMVRKIVLNGLLRLEQEGYGPFNEEQNDEITKR
ncbi:hypothetical protein [Klebsiella aerogenes]|uniref:hypothetical protein n=1 Tax=Klebsiella aerogenes TaxID=548 RepID=UPI001BCDB3CF|nr:hypothetical protein [Klebsiella aerogenes]